MESTSGKLRKRYFLKATVIALIGLATYVLQDDVLDIKIPTEVKVIISTYLGVLARAFVVDDVKVAKNILYEEQEIAKRKKIKKQVKKIEENENS